MMRTLAQTGNGWMTFKDSRNRACNQTARPGERRAPLQPLHRDHRGVVEAETAVCNLGLDQPGPTHLARTRASTSSKPARTVRTAVAARQGHRHQLLPESGVGARRTSAGGRSAWGCMGLQDVFFALRLPFDSARRARSRRASRRRSTSPRWSASAELAAERRAPTRPSPTRARRAASCSSTCGASLRPRPRAGTRCGSGSRDGPAQLAADRHRADGDHRLDRRVLRVHRAAGLEPVQARDAVGRLPPGQPLPGAGAQAPGPVDDRGPGAVKRRRARCRGSPATARRRAAAYSAPPGSCRCDRSSTWPRTAAPFIDQSQSLNLFVESPNIGKLCSMYFYAWKKGLKTTYYLRSRPATRIQQTTIGTAAR